MRSSARALWLMILLMPWSAKAVEREAVEGGTSPDGQRMVVNVEDRLGDHFEIRDKAGKTLFSEESIREDYFESQARAAEKVLWRGDSQYVAIAFSTSYLGVDTAIFRLVDGVLEPYGAKLDPYDPEKDPSGRGDTTHRLPSRWDEMGNLILEVSHGHGEKPEREITGKPGKIICTMGGNRLDEEPRARAKGWSVVSYASQSEFSRKQKNYRPASFEEWQKKLECIHPGMTLDEAKRILKPAEVSFVIGMGSGLVEALRLDDAYFVGCQVSPDSQKLIWMEDHPIAVTYELFSDRKPE